jgi:hypothetical protein
MSENVTLPYNVVFSTDKAARTSIKIDFDSNISILKYELWNNDRTDKMFEISFTLNANDTINLFGGAAAANAFKTACSVAMNNDLQSRVQTEVK